MKYKIGDKIRVRSWKAMEREFELDSIGNIKASMSVLHSSMGQYCGTVSEVVGITSGGNYNLDCGFIWSDDMFEGFAFEYGDEIEARDEDDEKWENYRYVGYADGAHYPYQTCDDAEFRHQEHSFIPSLFKQARPIQKQEETVTVDSHGFSLNIDGEDYSLSTIKAALKEFERKIKWIKRK